MNIDQARALVELHAPDLLTSEGPGHINIHKPITYSNGNVTLGPPFSITLPHSTEAMPLTAEQEEELFLQSLDAAKRTL